MHRDLTLLQALSEASAPPGREDEVRTIFKQEVSGYGDVRRDALGNAWVCVNSKKRAHILLDAHMDEVGFMVSHITDDGFLGFVPLGGWWAGALLAQAVKVLGNKGAVFGVVSCASVHLLDPKAREAVVPIEKLLVDVGASSRQEVVRMGLSVGDFMVPHAEFKWLQGQGAMMGKAFDNRLGVAAMISCLHGINTHTLESTVTGLASVQEEVGLRGVRAAMHTIKPDIAIVFEAAPADDAPRGGVVQGALGHGPQLRLFDPTTVFQRNFIDHVIALAKRSSIDIQVAVRRTGGTNAGVIHLHEQGVPCVVLGVPARYLHTHRQVAKVKDFEATCALGQALVQSLTPEVIEHLTGKSFN